MATVLTARTDDVTTLTDLRRQLEQHPVFGSLASIDDLREFMRAHVFAVWDFMSLLKRLQRDLTCVDVPWMPRGDRLAAHLINEIVLGEESDIAPDGQPASHLDIYLDAMRRGHVVVRPFHETRRRRQWTLSMPCTRAAPQSTCATSSATPCVWPPRSRRSVSWRTSSMAAKNVIPQMFNALLAHWQIDEDKAPMFVFYLKRHIEVDGESHGPMAQLIEGAIGRSGDRRAAVMQAAIESIRARIALWDGVHASLLELQAA